MEMKGIAMMHIVSHVEADIDKSFNAFDVLRSAFPAEQ